MLPRFCCEANCIWYSGDKRDAVLRIQVPQKQKKRVMSFETAAVQMKATRNYE